MAEAKFHNVGIWVIGAVIHRGLEGVENVQYAKTCFLAILVRRLFTEAKWGSGGQNAVSGQKKVSQTRGKRVWIAKSHFRKSRFQKQWKTQSKFDCFGVRFRASGIEIVFSKQ